MFKNQDLKVNNLSLKIANEKWILKFNIYKEIFLLVKMMNKYIMTEKINTRTENIINLHKHWFQFEDVNKIFLISIKLIPYNFHWFF